MKSEFVPDFMFINGSPLGRGLLPIIFECIGTSILLPIPIDLTEVVRSTLNEQHRNNNSTSIAKDKIIEDIIYDYNKDSYPDIHLSDNPTQHELMEHRRKILNHKDTRHREVFQLWPRSPIPGPISEMFQNQFESLDHYSYGMVTFRKTNNARGKVAPNGLELWGESLFDFYRTFRHPMFMPNMPGTLTSGSKMAARVKYTGEEYWEDIEPHLDRAEEEGNPKKILPCDIAKLITDGEMFMLGDASKKAWRNGSNDPDKRNDWDVPEPWPPASIFDKKAYPSPWPREPFLSDPLIRQLPLLQLYIPLLWLPQKLVVHDPWKLLEATGEPTGDEDNSWYSMEDSTHIYHLKLSSDFTQRKELDEKELTEDESERKKIYDTFLADPHSRNSLPHGVLVSEMTPTPGPAQPPIFVAFPFEGNRTKTPEAHLYLHPREKKGNGNHSHVYSAEWELPRNLLVRDDICMQCVQEDTVEILQREDGVNGEKRNPMWRAFSGKYVDRKKAIMNQFPGIFEAAQYMSGEDRDNLTYEGPYRVIRSRVQVQDLSKGPYCQHIRFKQSAIHPLTAKVRVAAKLSIRGDRHLEREAKNYQAFQKHFFEHYSGFNIVNSIKHPVPIGPLVPQFYGYYVAEPKEQEADKDGGNYLSPILLVEDCGVPIQPETLTSDDKSECGSLFHRFGEGGWVHGSIAKRNIVRQPGPLSDWPLIRSVNAMERDGLGKHWSYRLIDFGRSYNTDMALDRGISRPKIGEYLNDEYNQIEMWLHYGQALS